MTRRYFSAEIPTVGAMLALSDEESRHASRVMRAQVGETIELFDGAGTQAEAVIDSIDKRSCQVVIASRDCVDRESPWRSHFAIAFPKPERAKEMIERLTELGVAEVTPLVCQRTQRAPSSSLLSKLRRLVIESSKQCERNVLMRIHDPVDFSAFVSGCDAASNLWIAHPDGRTASTVFAQLRQQGLATVLVGPEGGFTESEVAEATNAGVEQVALGKRIYRIETAAVVLAAWLAE